MPSAGHLAASAAPRAPGCVLVRCDRRRATSAVAVAQWLC